MSKGDKEGSGMMRIGKEEMTEEDGEGKKKEKRGMIEG